MTRAQAATLRDGTPVVIDSIRVRFDNGSFGLVALDDVPALRAALAIAPVAVEAVAWCAWHDRMGVMGGVAHQTRAAAESHVAYMNSKAANVAAGLKFRVVPLAPVEPTR